MFFSHNKSVNSHSSLNFSDQRTGLLKQNWIRTLGQEPPSAILFFLDGPTTSRGPLAIYMFMHSKEGLSTCLFLKFGGLFYFIFPFIFISFLFFLSALIFPHFYFPFYVVSIHIYIFSNHYFLYFIFIFRSCSFFFSFFSLSLFIYVFYRFS